MFKHSNTFSIHSNNNKLYSAAPAVYSFMEHLEQLLKLLNMKSGDKRILLLCHPLNDGRKIKKAKCWFIKVRKICFQWK